MVQTHHHPFNRVVPTVISIVITIPIDRVIPIVISVVIIP